MGRNVEQENKLIEEIQTLSAEEPRRKVLLAQLFSSEFLSELHHGVEKRLREKADDAVQFSVVLFLENPKRYKVERAGRDGLLSYLYCIALRFKQPGREMGLSENAERELADTKSNRLYEELDTKELLETLRSLLDNEHQLILDYLMCEEGLTYVEIGEKLGISKSTVFNRRENILRVLNKLKGN